MPGAVTVATIATVTGPTTGNASTGASISASTPRTTDAAIARVATLTGDGNAGVTAASSVASIGINYGFVNNNVAACVASRLTIASGSAGGVAPIAPVAPIASRGMVIAGAAVPSMATIAAHGVGPIDAGQAIGAWRDIDRQSDGNYIQL